MCSIAAAAVFRPARSVARCCGSNQDNEKQDTVKGKRKYANKKAALKQKMSTLKLK